MTEPVTATPVVEATGPLLDSARQLVIELENGNEDGASHLINKLARVREMELFQEMGRLTRELHSAIQSVQLDDELAKLAESEMPEARERLDYVITLTEQAANRTMNAVDDSIPICDEMSIRASRLAETWERLTRRELNGDEFRVLSKDVQLFLANVAEDTATLRENMTDILMAQDFQDLTGQVIRRVTGMVSELEDQLVNLIKRTGGFEEGEMTSDVPDIEAEGPQIHHEKRDDVVSSQDDVDDLLSSLGF